MKADLIHENIEEFFAHAGNRQPELRQLDELICKSVPALAADRHIMPGMTKGMLSYGMYHYVYASGRQGDWPAVAIANQKHHISLYICAINDTGYLTEQYGKRLGDVDTGKSCVRFAKYADLNLLELQKILKETEKWWRDQDKPTEA